MQNVDWTGWVSGYPLDCYDYQSTYGAKNNQEQTRRTNIYVKRIQLGYQEILRIKVELDNFDTDGLKEENDKMLGFYMKGNWCI